jgi:plasmid stability protein
MATIRIRLPAKTKSLLRVRAAEHDRSLEAEAREILEAALSPKVQKHEDLYTAIRRIVEPLGGMDLNIPSRAELPRPLDLESERKSYR